MSYDRALARLHTMGDWLEMKSFKAHNLMDELEQFEDKWQPYNRKKPNNRFGLSITSLDGGLSGIPDLDSLLEYNKENGTAYGERDFKTFTDVYNNSPEIQEIIEQWKDKIF